VHTRGCKNPEFGGKVAREVNSGTKWAFNHEVRTGGSVWGGVPVLRELWRVGLEDRKATTVTSTGQNRAEMIEMANGRMKS
jgi:hypothetical protein